MPNFPDKGPGKSAAEVREELLRLGASRKRVRAGDVELMLAEPGARAFSDPGWFHELKYDGFRALAACVGGRPALFYRRGSEATALYPDLIAGLRALPVENAVFDGEIVALDDGGRPSFQRLQKRALLTGPREVARAAVELPATLFLFDLLGFEEFDLRPLPLRSRKALLQKLAPQLGPVRYVEHIDGRGEEMLRAVRALGLEGIVAKRADAPYRPGRSRDWLKIRLDRTGDFAVVGFSLPAGSRTGFGALHLARAEARGFVYVGRVGSGFREGELQRLRGELERDRVTLPPCSGPLPDGRGHTWVRARRVVEVRYRELTEEGLLRQPVFLRFREDKAPGECVLSTATPNATSNSNPTATANPTSNSTATANSTPTSARERRVELTNLDKVFWPEKGLRKADLIEYYRRISQWLLPYLRDRPLTLTRFPDGIAGKSFFQKDAPEFTPSWIRTARVFSEESGREIDQFVCDDVETLLYLANLGTIPLHVPASRVQSPDRADWCVLDLDPKGAPFQWVVKLARALHELCEEIALPSFVKTSGQAGLHVQVPLGGQCTHAQSRDLGQLLVRVVEARHPDLATTTRALAGRGGRVYLDYLQNGQGKTIAAPFSARPVAGATVSMPLRWTEVGPRLDPRRFTLKSAPARMRRFGKDPLAPVLALQPDLKRAVEGLGRILKRQ